MQSDLQKVLHKIEEKPMIVQVVEMIKKSGIKNPVVIIGYQGEEVKKILRGKGCRFAVQKKRLGTGHAVKQAENFLKDKKGYSVVVYGDCPFFSVRTLKTMVSLVKKEKPAICLTSMILDDKTKGIILRDKEGKIFGIVEGKNATAEQLKIHEKNAGLYLFDNQWLWKNIDKIKKNPLKKEYYLTDLIKIAANQNEKIEGVILDDHREALGVDTQVLLKKANKQNKFLISN